jgi:hypothetical protein
MTACRLMLSRAARASRPRSIPSVRSTFTRRIGRTTVNFPVKCPDTSSPRVAFAAIASADSLDLDVFGIAFLFFFRCLSCGDQPVELTFIVVSDFEDDRAKLSAAPANRTKLPRVIGFLVRYVNLIEDLLCLREADPVPGFDEVAL